MGNREFEYRLKGTSAWHLDVLSVTARFLKVSPGYSKTFRDFKLADLNRK